MILFHKENVHYNISNKLLIKNWIKSSIHNESKKAGDINIIFCDDDFLLQINKDYLKHDYYTDIITFQYNEKKIINGDLFISLDRVNENSIKYNSNKKEELLRVIIHGILHLCGYNDKTKDEKIIMTAKEDYYLSQIVDINL